MTSFDSTQYTVGKSLDLAFAQGHRVSVLVGSDWLDGYVLARALTESDAAISSRLLLYETVRRERTRRAVEGSADNIQRFHNRALADPAKAREYVDREWAGAPVAERYEWLFRYDATTVALH